MAVRVAIVALCAVLLVAGLTTGELYRNEGLRARLAWEGLAGGHLLVPTLYGEPHLTKPPGMSLLIVLASLPIGEVTPVTARLPSVAAGAIVIVLVGWAVGRCSGARAGWLAAAILPCAPLWLDRVPSAEIDLVQLAWVTASLLFFLRAEEKGRWRWWLAALLCVAGGFFTKWTAPAFFYLTVVPFLWWRRLLRKLISLPHLAALFVVVRLTVAWVVLVAHSAGWNALVECVSHEALLRLSPGHHPRPYPWDELATFPIGFLAGCLPWSLVALPALLPSFGRLLNGRERALRQLAVVWLFSSLAFWTLAPGHRPRHILPAQPAVAILAALVCTAWIDGRLGWRLHVLRPGHALGVILGSWLIVKLAWVVLVLPARQAGRDLRSQAALLAKHLPEEEILHLLHLKDDGLLFYHGRPARRLREPDATVGLWWLLTEAEWCAWTTPADVKAWLTDGQGASLVLIRAGGVGAKKRETASKQGEPVADSDSR